MTLFPSTWLRAIISSGDPIELGKEWDDYPSEAEHPASRSRCSHVNVHSAAQGIPSFIWPSPVDIKSNPNFRHPLSKLDNDLDPEKRSIPELPRFSVQLGGWKRNRIREARRKSNTFWCPIGSQDIDRWSSNRCFVHIGKITIRVGRVRPDIRLESSIFVNLQKKIVSTAGFNISNGRNKFLVWQVL